MDGSLSKFNDVMSEVNKLTVERVGEYYEVSNWVLGVEFQFTIPGYDRKFSLKPSEITNEGLIYFRLDQRDLDGKEYFPLTIEINLQDEDRSINLYRNNRLIEFYGEVVEVNENKVKAHFRNIEPRLL